jgi:hypothetical protein
MQKILFGTLTVLGAAGVVRGQSYTAPSIIPSADSFVSKNNPNNNYGAAGALEVSASTAANGQYLTYMQFNLSSVQSAIDSNLGSNWTVSNITLQLTEASPNNGIFNANAAGQFAIEWIENNSWTEGTGTPGATTTSGITYNNQPSAPDDELVGTFSYNGGSGTATYTLPVTAGELSNIEAGSLMTLEVLPNDSSVSYLFNSRTGASHPALTVTATVPEPASLGVIAGLSLLLLRRKPAFSGMRT